jgi:hypothetical protein
MILRQRHYHTLVRMMSDTTLHPLTRFNEGPANLAPGDQREKEKAPAGEAGA